MLLLYEESYCGLLSPTLIKKFAYVSSGSHNSAGRPSFFLSLLPCLFLFSYITKNLPDKENKGRPAKEAIVCWHCYGYVHVVIVLSLYPQ